MMSKKVIFLVLGLVSFFILGIFALKLIKSPKVNVAGKSQSKPQVTNQTQAQAPLPLPDTVATNATEEVKKEEGLTLDKKDDMCVKKKGVKKRNIRKKKKDAVVEKVIVKRDYGNVVGSVCVNGVCRGVTRGSVPDGEFISYRYQAW